MIYLVGFICFYAGYCLGVYLMRKVLNDYKEIHNLEIKSSMRNHISPSTLKALEDGAKIIEETQRVIRENSTTIES